MKLKNTCIVLGFLSLMISLLSFKNTTTVTESTVEPTEWKNLTVLPKDISKEDLKSLMKGYNAALGVKCSYCHAAAEGGDGLDFASDAKKEKEFARHMIVMTRKINAENFNWNNDPNPENINAVTCNMCHKGKASPKK
ncbi:c-type cytochrome [Myroides sp. 1354]|uniref:c-type cytochrome n=1 Tax=unclassified Myroides TaxID=2642485 RepID=UPI002578A26B|nr:MULTISPECIES: c-type cytochrome [unclassified Myroides]MDM1043579.1 c-type cytochrome [Myroides sp. R163-1]MDM1054371.1 c-type cytochrome [Myroides sp. 1354]MDM1067667.1 c-type cytochrome [Myroides sp. 1372]